MTVVYRGGLGLLLLLGCSQGSTEAERVRLRDEARLTLEAHCGACHIPTEPTAQAGALAVFDLSQEQWAQHMTRAQLQIALQRIEMNHLPDDPHGDLSVPREEVEVFRKYVEHELQRRR